VNFSSGRVKSADKENIALASVCGLNKERQQKKKDEVEGNWLEMVTYIFMMLFVVVLIFIVDICIKFFCKSVVCIMAIVMRATCTMTYHLGFYQTQQTSPPNCSAVSSRCDPCCCGTELDR
jgi:hypothetical protein